MMQVDTVVKDVLSYLTPAKTRPSTVQKLQQLVCKCTGFTCFKKHGCGIRGKVEISEMCS